MFLGIQTCYVQTLSHPLMNDIHSLPALLCSSIVYDKCFHGLSLCKYTQQRDMHNNEVLKEVQAK